LSNSLSRNEHSIAPAARSYATPMPAAHRQVTVSKNINRLLSAAVVSPRFRQLLLTDPAAALAAGYNGEKFQLTQAEYAAVTSLRVSTVRDFATQLLRLLQYATGDAPFYAPEAQNDFCFAEIAA